MLVALAAMATACGGGSGSIVVVSLTQGAGVSGVARVRVTLSNAGTSDVLTYPSTPSSSSVAFPATLAISLSSARSGVLDLALDGLDAVGTVVANGSAQTVIVVGGTTNASAILQAGPSLCGNGQIDSGETCDDGNRRSGDECSFECLLEARSDGGPPDAQVDGSHDGGTPNTDAASLDLVTNSDADARPADEPLPVPTDFVDAAPGGYKLGNPVSGSATTPSGLQPGPLGCQEIAGIVRDFKGFTETGGHPDFEHYVGQGTPGLVAAMLGADRKPVYASTCELASVPLGTTTPACPYGPQTTSKADFDEWYRDTPGVNLPYVLDFWFGPGSSGGWSLHSGLFFPFDGSGFGLSGLGEDGNMHDLGFTTELHVTFQYRGGEQFTFTGDDDAWVFVNGKLAIDLGGLHQSLVGTVDLDQMAATFGLTRGNTYPLDLFHAERHSTGSHFNIDTNIAFTTCGTLIP
jgi:fibro-slime domain-containing protein